jgi:hypothetical protein
MRNLRRTRLKLLSLSSTYDDKNLILGLENRLDTIDISALARVIRRLGKHQKSVRPELVEGQLPQLLVVCLRPFMARQAVSVLLGRPSPLTATPSPLQVHHARMT